MSAYITYKAGHSLSVATSFAFGEMRCCTIFKRIYFSEIDRFHLVTPHVVIEDCSARETFAAGCTRTTTPAPHTRSCELASPRNAAYLWAQ